MLIVFKELKLSCKIISPSEVKSRNYFNFPMTVIYFVENKILLNL